ncbi:MAG: RNA methyltransferase [Nitrospirota bacterium]
MKNWKDNIFFVLIEPREPGNVGASARAIKNMGFKRLCLVNPAPLTDEAKWFAHNAEDVLENAGIYSSLSEAIADKSLVVAVARRTGKRRGMIYPLEQGVPQLHKIACDNKVALLFGREDRGLYNEEVNECGMLLTIPSSREHPSLNLSHAIIVVAYELSRAEYREVHEREKERKQKTRKREYRVTYDELTSLYERMTGALILLDYIPRGDRNLHKHIMQNLKHLIGRVGLTDWELKMLHGICTQIERKLGQQ